MSLSIYTFLIVLVGWVFSVCLHEWAHAFAAYKFGDRSVKDKGYLSFNPLRYTDPFTSLVLPVAFLMLGGLPLPGGAVYIDYRAIRSTFQQSLVSLAGPMANLALAIVIGLLLRFVPPAENAQPALAFLGQLQLAAVILNLLPIPPLDGFGILRPHLHEETQRASMEVWWIGFILIFVLFQIPAFRAAFWGAVDLLCRYLGIDEYMAHEGLKLFMFWR
jgi:Zn-dependent protease